MSYITPEKKVQNKIIDYLKHLRKSGHPIEFERRQAGGFNYDKGKPDIWIVYNGIHIEVEVKQKNGYLSINQQKWKERFEKINCKYMTVDSFEDFLNKFSLILF